MSEPKLCPFLKDSIWVPEWDEGLEIGRCLEDKCAMWRKTTKTNTDFAGARYESTTGGYCGLAGKP